METVEATGSESTVIRSRKHQKRTEKVRKKFHQFFGTKRPRVQVPQPGPKPPVFTKKTGGFDISRNHSFLCLLRRIILPSVELHKQPERDMMYKTSSRNLHFLIEAHATITFPDNAKSHFSFGRQLLPRVSKIYHSSLE